MCTLIKSKSKRKYGYKVVIDTGSGVISMIGNHVWRKGVAIAGGSRPNDVWQTDAFVRRGVFHCLPTRSEARYFKNVWTKADQTYMRPLNKYRIIKVIFPYLKNVWDGTHFDSGPAFNGRPTVVSTKVMWDGKFIR